jgi:hypothetical protein
MVSISNTQPFFIKCVRMCLFLSVAFVLIGHPLQS